MPFRRVECGAWSVKWGVWIVNTWMLDGYKNSQEWRIWRRVVVRRQKQCRFGGGLLGMLSAQWGKCHLQGGAMACLTICGRRSAAGWADNRSPSHREGSLYSCIVLLLHSVHSNVIGSLAPFAAILTTPPFFVLWSIHFTMWFNMYHHMSIHTRFYTCFITLSYFLAYVNNFLSFCRIFLLDQFQNSK